jgi:hypothetical protein
MNPAPGLPTDLHYADDEQVQLDLAAIIARGAWLRRRRRLVKVAAAAAAAACAIVPAAILLSSSDPMLESHPSTVAGWERRLAPSSGAGGAVNARLGRPKAPGYAPLSPSVSGPPVSGTPAFRTWRLGDESSTALEAGTQVAKSVPTRFGSLVAIAGARARSGVWFTAASARLTLIHLSANGTMRSWELPVTSRQLRASTNVGFAVSAGVAWLSVGSKLLRVDTKARSKAALISSWPVPVPSAPQASAYGTNLAGNANSAAVPPTAEHASNAATARTTAKHASPQVVHQTVAESYSLAVSPRGSVAVARPNSTSVQLFDSRSHTFREIRLPATADRPLAVGFARDGVLGIGYLTRSGAPKVMLVDRSGARHTAAVAQASAITAYGKSALLVGISRPEVVSALGKARPLVLPADQPGLGGDVSAPARLPEDRLGIALDAGILTFPASATSVAEASYSSELWLTPQPRCATKRCLLGYGLVATDAAGNLWVVPSADQHVIELLRLG